MAHCGLTASVTVPRRHNPAYSPTAFSFFNRKKSLQGVTFLIAVRHNWCNNQNHLKMKKIVFAVFALALVGVGFYISARGIVPSKKIITIEKTFSSFDEVSISSAISATYVQTSGSNYKVTVSAPENVIDCVGVVQDKNEIKIGMMRKSSFDGNPNVKVIIYSPALSEVEVCGASSFRASSMSLPGRKIDIEVSGASSVNVDRITGTKIDVEASGASKVRLGNVASQSLDVEVLGASTAVLEGKSEKVDFEASGASSIKALSLVASIGELDCCGASAITSNITNVTSRKISGASSIKNR